MKAVRLTAHALGYVQSRGFTIPEVKDAILSTPWEPAERGKLECHKEYPFDAVWNGEHYATKQVRPVFVEEELEIVVITVYTYYY